jgi:hypothetical protein
MLLYGSKFMLDSFLIWHSIKYEDASEFFVWISKKADVAFRFYPQVPGDTEEEHKTRQSG